MEAQRGARNMNIGEVAKLSGISAKTIRYYESVGLLPKPLRAANGYRYYRENDLQTLRFIHRSRNLGFTIKDIRDLLGLWQDTGRASADVREVAKRHVSEIERRLEEMESVRQTLMQLIHKCHGDDRPDCPILQDLAGEEG